MSGVDVGGTLLCAVDRDDRAPALVAAARAWAAAAMARPVFVHVGPAPNGGPPAADAARAALAAVGIADDELRVATADPVAALHAEIAATAPALVLVGSSTAADGAVGQVEDPLTPRELEVVKLIAEGHTTKEIAQVLVISENTVERHRSNVLDKLGLRDRVALALYAVRRGLIEP
jgi:DNA-binding CsgD family transcriptional regulator